MSLLRCEQLSVTINRQTICSSLELELIPGECIALLGRNGIGKTTLLHTLAGLRSPDAGEVLINNASVTRLTRKQIAQQLGVLLQQQEDSFPIQVIESVLMGRHPYMNALAWETQQDRQQALQFLHEVGLESLAYRLTTELSGGERQRAAIATLLMQNPQILLLDEPNAHLDYHYQAQILNHLTNKTVNESRGLIMSLHDINLAQAYCSRVVLLMGDGEVRVGDTHEILEPALLSRAYDHPIRRIETDTGFWFSPDLG